MRRALVLVLLAGATAHVDAHGQAISLRSGAVGLSFTEPDGVGLQSYRMVSTKLSLTYDITPWLGAGARVAHARADLKPPGMSGVTFAGPTDAHLFIHASPGPLRLRVGAMLPTGTARQSSSALMVSGLAGYELLPLPVRSWASGGGLEIEAGLPFRAGSVGVELFAALRQHRPFEPFLDDPLEYRLGAERLLGVNFTADPTALSRVVVGGRYGVASPDEALSTEVLEAGWRASGFVVVSGPIGRSQVAVRTDLYYRAAAETPEPLVGEGDPLVLVLGGRAASTPRTVLAAALGTLTPTSWLPLVTTVRARTIREELETRGWLASIGIGTEMDVGGPWPGTTTVSPTLQLHRGHMTVAEGYDSPMRGWTAEVALRWMGGP